MTFLPPSSSLTPTSLRGWNSSVPLGPCTDTTPLLTAIFTPAGTGTGLLPIRDMMSSVNFADHFAAGIFLTSFAVAEHASAGADDRDSHATQHGFEILGLAVDPAAGLADTFDVLDDLLAVRTVFQ